MKCENCNQEGSCRYLTKLPKIASGDKQKNAPRKDFSAECKRCGWKGETR